MREEVLAVGCAVDPFDAIRQWVRGGGKLIATGGTSLVNKQGQCQPDFMLADVFGVSIVEADWSNRNHYLAPTAAGQFLFPEFDSKYPAFSPGQGFQVKAHEGAEILANTVLPWPRADSTRFSSIHSDPPWVVTEYPEITRNAFGSGAAIYCATLIENMENAESAIVNLVRQWNETCQFEVDAPPAVEATLFRQPDRKRYVLSLVNFQKEMPNIPVRGVRCRLNVAEPIESIRQLAVQQRVPFQRTEWGIEFQAPELTTLLQFEAVWG